MTETRLNLGSGFPVGVFILAASLVFGGMPQTTEAQADCLFCMNCGSEGKIGNWAPNGGIGAVNSRGAGSHRFCAFTGNCSEQHPRGCGPVMADSQLGTTLALIHDAVKRGDRQEAYSLASDHAHGSRIYYSMERQAVQAIGCDGTVVVHIPIDLGNARRMTRTAFALRPNVVPQKAFLLGHEGTFLN